LVPFKWSLISVPSTLNLFLDTAILFSCIMCFSEC
jgi:hypothetical protein